MRDVNLIVLHHSDSDVAAHDDIAVIKEWHTLPKDEGGNGWNEIGYHYFIRKDGLLQKGRDLDKIGSHCKGKNKRSIGICLSGRKKFTHHQFAALKNIIYNIEAYYDKTMDIKGHNEYSKKSCPVFDVSEFIETYL